jgi:CheY-like chemotaxis protein
MENSGVRDLVLAEDDLDDLLIFELALDKLAFQGELRHAEDGDKLFSLLAHQTPDIIFLDINMPCKDGISCISEIRRNPEFNNVPVIMYTALRRKEYIEDCYSTGANFYLIKADSIAALAKKLGVILSIDWKTFMYFPPESEFVIDGV